MGELVQAPPPMGWQTRLLRSLPGIIVGLGLALALRFTTLDSATRIFLSSLPMWFLLTLGSELAGTGHPWRTRILRAAAYALFISSLLYGLTRAAQ